MFAIGLGEAATAIKTHSGLTALFHREIIKTGLIKVEIGKALDQVEQFRLSSDYFDGKSPPPDANWAVEQAEVFLKAVDLMGSRP